LIRDLPFVWRLTPSDDCPRPDNIPARMDFVFDWDADLGLLKQKQTPELMAALDAVYAAGSENLGATEEYGEDFFRFVASISYGRFADKPKATRSSLEISPGTGWLSEKLGDLPVQTFTHTNAEDGPFPPGDSFYAFGDYRKMDGFDMVIAHYVLEHVPSPVEFLRAMGDKLGDDGIAFGAVPDCSLEVRLGDVSMATSQHLSYFTEQSLTKCLLVAGFKYGSVFHVYGSLFFWASRDAGRYGDDLASLHNTDSYGRFLANAVLNMERVEKIAVAVGIPAAVCPMRAFPYNQDNFSVMYDDGMAGKYLDGYAQQIRPLMEIDADRVALVFSWTYGQMIEDKLRRQGVRRIITLREMLDV